MWIKNGRGYPWPYYTETTCYTETLKQAVIFTMMCCLHYVIMSTRNYFPLKAIQIVFGHLLHSC